MTVKSNGEKQTRQLPSGFPAEGQALLRALFQDATGFVEIRTKDTDGHVMQHFFPDADTIPWSSVDSIAWSLLKELNGKSHDIWFGVCPRKSRQGSKTAVSCVPAFWVDLDARDFSGGKDEALTQFKKLPPYLQPSIIVDSGHGYHAYWLLKESEKIETPDDIGKVEGYLKGLAEAIGADSVHDISRVLRMPGTMNWKDHDNPCSCRIAYWDPELRYNPSDFEEYWVKITARGEGITFSDTLPDVDLDALKLTKRTRELISEGWKLDCGYKTRSEADQAVITALLKTGCSDDQVRSVFSNINLGIGEKYKQAGDSYLAHSIANAKAYLKSRKSGKPSGKYITEAQKLVDHAVQEGIDLFKNQHGDPWGRISLSQHFENWPLYSKAFRHYIGALVYQKEEKPANPEAIRSAVETLAGEALFGQKKTHHLHNRVASYEGAIYYDLSDERWRAIRVTQDGWEIVEKPPILFRRYKKQLPQVEPMKGGDPSLLLNLVRVRAEDRLLLLVYAISCLIPDIPHPILWVQGPEGSAKSGLCRMLVIIIDPSSPALLAMQTQLREMVQQLDHGWLAVFDNVQGLADWQSDCLCRAVTGDGFTKRELYSDDDDVIYAFKRCVALNAINLESDRPDLLSRALIIRLESIPDDQRKTEEELRQALEQDRASIVGGLLDALSRAMSLRQQIKLAAKPRMADFAEWGCAIAQALGREQKEFLDSYYANMRGLRGAILEENVVATVLLRFLQANQSFEGNATELLNKLTNEAENMTLDTKAKGWPKAPNALSRQLNSLKVNLEKEGVSIETLKNVGKDKIKRLKITTREVDDDSDVSKQKTSSLSTPSASEADKRDDGGDDVERRDDDDRRCLASRSDGDDVSENITARDDKESGEISF